MVEMWGSPSSPPVEVVLVLGQAVVNVVNALVVKLVVEVLFLMQQQILSESLRERSRCIVNPLQLEELIDDTCWCLMLCEGDGIYKNQNEHINPQRVSLLFF